jgi:hypothetical protein
MIMIVFHADDFERKEKAKDSTSTILSLFECIINAALAA